MATHLKKLLAEEFVSEKKEFINKKPQTTYSITKKGKEEFIAYINLLKSLIPQEEEEDAQNFMQNSAFVPGF